MGKLISIIVTVGIFAAVLIFGGAFYIVNESEQVELLSLVNQLEIQ